MSACLFVCLLVFFAWTLILFFFGTIGTYTDPCNQVMEPIRYRENLSQESDINNCIQEMFYSVVISFADCLKDLTDIIESENSEVR